VSHRPQNRLAIAMHERVHPEGTSTSKPGGQFDDS
jgi:hypothetical protein